MNIPKKVTSRDRYISEEDNVIDHLGVKYSSCSSGDGEEGNRELFTR